MNLDPIATGSRRTTWPAALPLQQAADTLRAVASDITGPLAGLADPVADLLEEYANNLAWLAPFRPHEGGYAMWETVTRVANIVNGTAATGDSAARPDQPDRCPRCHCDDCGGLLSKHVADGCGCEGCTTSPEYACAAFRPDGRVAIFAQELGPLLSVHLGSKQQRRCLAVAHAAHHALLDCDHPKERP